MDTFRLENFDTADFPFVLNEPGFQYEYPMHNHDFSELVIVRGGAGIHLVDDQSYPIGRGDVFVISPEVGHAYADTAGMRISNLIFNPRQLPLPMAYLNAMPGYLSLFEVEPRLRKQHEFASRLKLSEAQLRQALAHLEDIRTEYNSRRDGSRAAVIAGLTALIVFLSRCYHEKSEGDKAYETVSRLGQLAGMMADDCSADFSLESMARYARMSQRSFLRNFKNAFGVSPGHYLMRLRIVRAGEMLVRDTRPVGEIAAACGFEDSNYFSRQFRKYAGVSPGECRRRGMNSYSSPSSLS